MIAQAYSLNTVRLTIHSTYRSQYIKEPPQFSAQAFAAVQVYVEALNTIDKQTDISTMPLEQLRTELNKHLLAGKQKRP